jgi:hypothetical protein
MKKILALLAMLGTLLALNLSTATPAQAAWGTDVKHASDDSGYTADIHIICTNGNHRYLAVGEWTLSQKPCGYGGVQRIVVGYNQTVYCKNYMPPYQNIYYYTGNYNEVPSGASLKCYMQRPL